MRALARGRRHTHHRDHEPWLQRRAKSALKRGVRSVVRAPADQRRALLVFGCQRSGTTMLQQSLLDCSWRVIILEEHDRRLVRPSDPEHLRWDSLDRVSPRVMALPFELVVSKPLVESHRVRELLDSFERAKAIWMLRHYRSVARSNLQRFGADNGQRDLRLLVKRGPANWRGVGTEEVRDRVAALLTSNLSPLDAAAVFWWARNRLYLDQELWSDDRIRVMRYEVLLEYPQECLQALSEFVDIQLPMTAMKRRIRPAAAAHAELRPDVECLCSELLEKFEKVPDFQRR
jgi:sulfotransferase family protein